MNFVLKGQIPSGKNAMQVTRTGRHYPLKRFVDWRSDVEAQIRQQVGYPKAIETPCSAGFSYWPGDMRRRDVPGMVDALFHVFERFGIVKDDALIKHITWTQVGMDRVFPRVQVRISTEKLPEF